MVVVHLLALYLESRHWSRSWKVVTKVRSSVATVGKERMLMMKKMLMEVLLSIAGGGMFN